MLLTATNVLPAIVRGLPSPPEVRVHASVTEIPRAEWQRLLPGEPENWDYYRVVETAPPPNFKLGAISVWMHGMLVAVAPLFRVVYRIDTPLQGGLRTAAQWLYERVPGLVSLAVIGIGSPSSDTCSIGFAPALDDAGRRAVFDAMLTRVQALADEDKSALVAVKSIDGLAASLDETFRAHHFARVTSVPLVILDLPFASFEAYMASLPSKTRGYLKRKMRGEHNLLFGLTNDAFGYILTKVDYKSFPRYDYVSRVSLGEMTGEILIEKALHMVGE